jgi:hypothetical protein
MTAQFNQWLLILINICTIAGVVWGLLHVSFNLGLSMEKFKRTIKEEYYYTIKNSIDVIEQKVKELENAGKHTQEISAIKQESAISTIASDIANIVNNIDDIEVFLIKRAGYHRRPCKLIHGKKRKLTPKDIETLDEY